ncbi:sulfonate ABC transporter substrate-binding protein [Bacillus safensis FO-36b] [Bacillus safensis subsp. safensis]
MNGEATDSYSPGFTLVRTQFADQHPELVVKFSKVYDHAVKWQKSHPEEAVTLYARLKNLDKKVVTQVLNNTEPLNKPISKKIINALAAYR